MVAVEGQNEFFSEMFYGGSWRIFLRVLGFLSVGSTYWWGLLRFVYFWRLLVWPVGKGVLLIR